MNNTLEQALPIKVGSVPPGTIVVKENLTPRRQRDKLTVMAKVKGFDPEAGDWFWAVFSAQGEVLREGRLEGCISCHEGVRGNDYLVIHRLDSPVLTE
jgi:hypothetical protein